MADEKELLPPKEYEKIGDMLLALIKACPYVPTGMIDNGQILYQSLGTAPSIGIYTLPGAKYVKKYISGGFIGRVNIQIGYKAAPTSNKTRTNAQAVVDNIMGWLEDIENLPELSGGRKVTGITASSSFATLDEVSGDKSTVFAADAEMRYEKKGEK